MRLIGLGGFGVVLSTAAALVNSSMQNNSVVNYSAFNDQQVEEYLKEVAGNLNRELPRSMDAETRGDRVVARNNVIRFNYTIMNYSASQIDMNVLTEEAEANLVDGICGTEDMRTFEQMDVTVEYAYKGNDGRQIGVIAVDSYDCRESR